MDPVILSRFDEKVRAELFGRYGLETEAVVLSDWHAFTFLIRDNRFERILRVTDDTHRTSSEIEAELEWMEYLRGNGIRVPDIFSSKSGRKTEIIEANGSRFTAVLFEKLDGRLVADSDWNGDLFERWGALVGRLHRLSLKYEPTLRRAEWHESDFLKVDAYIPDDLPQLKRAGHQLIQEIKNLPQAWGSYGLMHADVYQDNFFLNGNQIQLFDFDNSEFGFFVNDIAISLYAALWRLGSDDKAQEFTEVFLGKFLEGYRAEFDLEKSQWEQLPLFLRLRDLLIYLVTRKKRDLFRLTPMQARRFGERENRIQQGLPVVDVSKFLKG